MLRCIIHIFDIPLRIEFHFRYLEPSERSFFVRCFHVAHSIHHIFIKRNKVLALLLARNILGYYRNDLFRVWFSKVYCSQEVGVFEDWGRSETGGQDKLRFDLR